jgi:hypothetical protein
MVYNILFASTFHQGVDGGCSSLWGLCWGGGYPEDMNLTGPFACLFLQITLVPDSAENFYLLVLHPLFEVRQDEDRSYRDFIYALNECPNYLIIIYCTL